MSVHSAAKRGDMKELKTLIVEVGVSPEEVDGHLRQTPLHYACKHGQVEAVKFLLAQGAKPNVTNSQGWTALNIACGSGKAECAHAMLAGGANPNIPSQCNLFPIHRSSTRGDEAVIGALLKSGAEPSPCEDVLSETPLHFASREGHLSSVRRLLGATGELNQPNKHMEMPILCAASRGHESVVLALISLGAVVDVPDTKHGLVVIHYVAKFGMLLALSQLLRQNASVDVQDLDGNTPLALATASGHVDVARALLRAGARSDIPNRHGHTPAVSNLEPKMIVTSLARADPAREDAMQRRLLAMKGTRSLLQKEQQVETVLAAERGALATEAAVKSERERRRVEREQQEKSEAAAWLMRQHACTDLLIRCYRQHLGREMERKRNAEKERRQAEKAALRAKEIEARRVRGGS
jgi:ankyrin repeat protein